MALYCHCRSVRKKSFLDIVNIPGPGVFEQKRKVERTERRLRKEERGIERIKFPKSPSTAMILEKT